LLVYQCHLTLDQSDSTIAQKIFSHFKRTPANYKLGVLYVVDAITRRWIEQARQAGQELFGSSPAAGSYASGVQKMTELMPTLVDDTIRVAPQDQKVRENDHRGFIEMFHGWNMSVLLRKSQQQPSLKCLQTTVSSVSIRHLADLLSTLGQARKPGQHLGARQYLPNPLDSRSQAEIYSTGRSSSDSTVDNTFRKPTAESSGVYGSQRKSTNRTTSADFFTTRCRFCPSSIGGYGRSASANRPSTTSTSLSTTRSLRPSLFAKSAAVTASAAACHYHTSTANATVQCPIASTTARDASSIRFNVFRSCSTSSSPTTFSTTRSYGCSGCFDSTTHSWQPGPADQGPSTFC